MTISSSDASDRESRLATAPAPGVRLRKIEPLEKKLRSSPAGARLADEIDRHAPEVLHLVNHSRRVGVVWQKFQGPRFIRAIMDSGFDGVAIPREVQGVRLEELMLHMADALQRHGSPELRHAIADHAEKVLLWARACEHLDDLFRRLAEADDTTEAQPT